MLLIDSTLSIVLASGMVLMFGLLIYAAYFLKDD